MAAAAKVLPMIPRDVFPGPRPFKVAEARLFYGRDREASQLEDLFLTYQDVLLYAPSGAGKTSLINARLVHKLLRANCYVGRVGGELSPGVQLDKVPNIFAYNLIASIVKDSKKMPAVGPDMLKKYLRPLATHGEPTFLIVDQLEEIFTTYPERWNDRQGFFKDLQSLLKDSPAWHVLLSIREEYVAPLEFYSDLFPNQLHIRYHLQGLRPEQAAEAIRGPLSASQYMIDEKAADRLVDSLRTVPVKTPRGIIKIPGEFVEPLHLQLVCRNLVSKLKSPRITERELADFADVDQTLADFYQRAVEATAGKSKVDEVKIRRWFDDKLITPAGTRGIVFQGKEDTEGLPNRAVDVLARERIIRREWRAGALWYELTHDRFIEPIRESNTRWREQLSQPLWLKQLVWPDDDLRNWLDSKASQILYNCALRVHLNMSKEQIVDEYLAGLKQKGAKDPSEENWRQAELYLANDVLDGKFDLVRSLTPDSYPRIEGDEGRMWLRELKALKAYLNWEARKAAPASEGQVEDYLTACQQIRDQLRNPQRKRPPDAFEPIQKYIENNFFTHGRLDCEKERTKLWIEAKKQRLLANTDKNKADAEHDAVDFMEKFYGHISSAVLGTGAKREESIRSVLQALGYCSPFEPYEAMVNCFEMAVAIAFLDHEKTGQILEEQEKTE